MNTNTNRENRQRDLEELAFFLDNLSSSVTYLKLLSIGQNSTPAFNGEIASDEATHALIEAFFTSQIFPSTACNQSRFDALSDALEIASMEIKAIAQSEQ